MSGDQSPAHARGCTAQIGGKVRRPPTTGPDGPRIWYGDGAGVGSALAVGTATTKAVTAVAARTMFLTVFIASILLWCRSRASPHQVRKKSAVLS